MPTPSISAVEPPFHGISDRAACHHCHEIVGATPSPSTIIRHHQSHPWPATATTHDLLSPRNRDLRDHTTPEPLCRRQSRTAAASANCRYCTMATAPGLPLHLLVMSKSNPFSFSFVTLKCCHRWVILSTIFSFFYCYFGQQSFFFMSCCCGPHFT